MLSTRQNQILKLIINEYIKSVRPISSSLICEQLDCSSATIRNEMAILEEIGLLEKTHTSSGRIPSEKGYRYYVDNLLELTEISGEDMLKLQTIFENNSLVLNDAISKSMEIVSELTNYTAIVLGSSSKENKVSKIEAIPLPNRKMVTIIVTDKGHVENKEIIMDAQVSLEEIRQTVDLLNKLIIGTPIDEVACVLEFKIKPIIGNYIKQHEILYNAFYNAFNTFAKDTIKMSGTKNILMQPEFDNIDKIRNIINKFDDKTLVNSIKEEDNGINIYIGSENELDDDLTIIKTKYNINGNEGTLALIGPKRMEYNRVLTLLNYIKQNISDCEEI
ncbi:MAG: heat-inducible transcription repressor HrcA [Tenericutes bacterium]|jgi:heat-inducible transcriptional repressor|nr:heat-inducible transcription repressor HrcA [Mycoplasmatota bacterium]